jgi:hypothetical protein
MLFDDVIEKEYAHFTAAMVTRKYENKSKQSSNLVSSTLKEANTVGADSIFTMLAYLYSYLLAQVHKQLNMLF